MFERLALWCHRRRRLVVVIWLTAAVAAVLGGSALSGAFADGGRLPGTDSDAAYQVLAHEFPSGGGDSATVVFQRDGGVTGARQAIDAYLARVAATAGIAGVVSPFDHPAQVAAGRKVAYATIEFTAFGRDAYTSALAARDAVATTPELTSAAVRVDFSGPWYGNTGPPSTEMFGFLAAIVILLIAFGSVVAMGLPIVTAIAGIVLALAGVGAWANVVSTPDFTVQVASMVGIGVGIDYALFIVTRYRAALTRWGSPDLATAEAIGTAGRAVAFAGVTVMISLLGMFLMGLPFLYGLAIGTATAVLIAVLAALTLLPALLGFVGHRLDRFSIHRRHARSGRESGWHRWSRFVQRHPRRFAAGGLLVLLAAGAPVMAMRLASADAGNDPAASTTRHAFDALADGFGPGVNGPLVVTVHLGSRSEAAGVAQLRARLLTTPGVAAVSAPAVSGSGHAAAFTVLPTTAPQDTATAALVHRLRSDVLAHTGLEAHVGGRTASDIDFATKMSSRLPVFIGAVLALSFVLLLIVFRSVLVPLKAVLMNLLSIGAAYGVMVAVFQWGWLGSVFGVERGAPIEPWAPMMLFAIVFGLSMDYEVFLLSSVKERYDRDGDNGSAVVEGLASTARVITAAAAIMVCVFGTFVLGDDHAIKLIGLGLATAVLFDATIVRMVLVPATMELLGRRNWWLPRWLDRLLPHFSPDGTAHTGLPVQTVPRVLEGSDR